MKNNLIGSIDELNLDIKIIKKLTNNNINKMDDLWKLNRKTLKKMNLSDSEINNIIIKLQLMGLDLNKKIYNAK